METRTDPAIEAGGQVLEDEICRLTESLGRDRPASQRLAEAGRKTARRVLDSWPLAFALLATLGVMTALNLGGYGPTQLTTPEVSASEASERLVRVAKFAATEAARFRAERGRLPASPQEIGLGATDEVVFETGAGGEVIAIARGEGIQARSDRGGVQRLHGGGR